ncbi:MAG: hypothetical protein ACREIA_25330 [Opitutaceae bacterium]
MSGSIGESGTVSILAFAWDVFPDNALLRGVVALARVASGVRLLEVGDGELGVVLERIEVVVTGSSSSTCQRFAPPRMSSVLIRAVGPTLAGLGVEGTLANPVLTLSTAPTP